MLNSIMVSEDGNNLAKLTEKDAMEQLDKDEKIKPFACGAEDEDWTSEHRGFWKK